MKLIRLATRLREMLGEYVVSAVAGFGSWSIELKNDPHVDHDEVEAFNIYVRTSGTRRTL